MIKITEVEVFGWSAAFRGMRNPLESWNKKDSEHYGYSPNIDCSTCPIAGTDYCATDFSPYVIGPNDLKLAKNLVNAGTDHAKFMRFIICYCDIEAPFYWHKEMDTYRAGVEKNSCSTMHKIHSKDFTFDDFSCEHMSEYSRNLLEQIIKLLNRYRGDYNATKNKSHWWQLIQLLPNSYNQKRTYMISYAALRNMYHARKNHKLDEWHTFCAWVKTLPYSELITGEDTNSCSTPQ